MTDYREGGHLPRQREHGLPPDPAELPRQRRGKTPQMHGRYPDYDVLEQAGNWDEVTRKVVLDRVEHVPPIRFFEAAEARTLEAFCDTVTAQDAEPRIAVVAYVDEKLHDGRLDGYQYDDMPDDRDVWRRVARGLDEVADRLGAPSFAEAPGALQYDICDRFAKGELEGGVWDEMPAKKAWSVVMRGVLQAFYAHPWAWNEIGFGGPAYPRGYSRLGIDQKEAWEGDEAFSLDPVRDTSERELP